MSDQFIPSSLLFSLLFGTILLCISQKISEDVYYLVCCFGEFSYVEKKMNNDEQINSKQYTKYFTKH